MLLQRGEVLLGLGQVVDDQIGLADVLVRAAVPRIELQRARVVLEGKFESARRCDRRSRDSSGCPRCECRAAPRKKADLIAALQSFASIACLARCVIRVETGGRGDRRPCPDRHADRGSSTRPRQQGHGQCAKSSHGPTDRNPEPPTPSPAGLAVETSSGLRRCCFASRHFGAVAVSALGESRELAEVGRCLFLLARSPRPLWPRRRSRAAGWECSSSTLRTPSAPLRLSLLASACRRAARASGRDDSPSRRASRSRLRGRRRRA